MKDKGDFFPYGSDEKHFYWSGYFSSRPTFKKHIKDSSAILHSSDKAYAYKVIDQEVSASEIKDILQA